MHTLHEFTSNSFTGRTRNGIRLSRGILCLCASLMLAWPGAGSAGPQSQSAPRAGSAQPTQPEAKAPRQTSGPFRGKLAAINKAAKTITVGKRTFQVTPETKITRGSGSATFESGVLQEEASGYFVTAPDGKLTLKSLRYGPKPGTDAEKSGKKKTQ